MDLERAADAHEIARADGDRRLGVDAREARVQRLDAERRRLLAVARADGGVGRRRLEEAHRERAEVEARAAHDDGHAPARRDVGDGGARERRPARGVERLVGPHDVEQVVRDLARSSRVGLAVPTSMPT